MLKYKPILVENDKFTLTEVIFNIFLVDESTSMTDSTKIQGVNNVLKKTQQCLIGMEYTGNTRVCIVRFGSTISATPLKEVEKFSSRYSPRGGCTVLYDTIAYVRDRVLELYKKYVLNNGRRVIFNITILSDGDDQGSDISLEGAKLAVAELEETVPNFGIIIYDLGSKVREVAKALGIERKEVPVTEAGLNELAVDISTSLVESSTTGLPITDLSKNQSGSTIAAKDEFKKMVDKIETGNIYDLLANM